MSVHARNAVAPKWSTEQGQRAKKMWLDGEKAEVIGLAVGRSRCAVIGYANRMGWRPHPYGNDSRRWA